MLRWTKEKAAKEFGLNPRTLDSRLIAANETPGEDARFSTQQIMRAVYGDIDGERLREVRHRANLLELEELELRRQTIPASQVSATWEAIIVGLRSGVLNSELSEQKKRDLMDDLRQIPVDEYFKTAKPADEESE